MTYCCGSEAAHESADLTAPWLVDSIKGHPFFDGEGLEFQTVIDCHTHIGPGWNLPRRMAGAESLLGIMDTLGVHVSCVSSLRALAGDMRGGNDDVVAALQAYPDRFVGAAVFNPHYRREAEAELDRLFDVPGVAMLKVHPAFHSYPLSGPAYDPVWKFASDARVPVLAHTWGDGPGYDHPTQVQVVAERYPDVPLIMAHSGGTPSGIEAAIEVANACPNTYLDTAFSLVNRGAINHMVKSVGASRVLFGSDAVYLAAPPQVGRILDEINAEDAEMVFGHNMLQLLSKSGRSIPALTAMTGDRSA